MSQPEIFIALVVAAHAAVLALRLSISLYRAWSHSAWQQRWRALQADVVVLAVRQVSPPPARVRVADRASLRGEGSHLRPLDSSPSAVVLPSSGAIAREEMAFAGLGLALKIAGLLLALVTLTKLALAHQQRLERHGEIQAVLQLQLDRLTRQKRELDRLFSSDGHQVLFRREEQWIAPNRRRIIWLPPDSSSPP